MNAPSMGGSLVWLMNTVASPSACFTNIGVFLFPISAGCVRSSDFIFSAFLYIDFVSDGLGSFVFFVIMDVVGAYVAIVGS